MAGLTKFPVWADPVDEHGVKLNRSHAKGMSREGHEGGEGKAGICASTGLFRSRFGESADERLIL